MECRKVLEKVDVFLRVDLASESLSPKNVAKLVELQECVKVFLNRNAAAPCSDETGLAPSSIPDDAQETAVYVEFEDEIPDKAIDRSKLPLPAIPTQQYNTGSNGEPAEGIYIDPPAVTTSQLKQPAKNKPAKINILKKTLSKTRINTDKHRKTSMDDGHIPADFTGNLRVCLDGKWSKRICSIRSNMLVIKGKKGEQTFDLEDCEVMPDYTDAKSQYVFKLLKGDVEQILMKASSSDEMGKWVKHILHAQTAKVASQSGGILEEIEEDIYIDVSFAENSPIDVPATPSSDNQEEALYVSLDPIEYDKPPCGKSETLPRNMEVKSLDEFRTTHLEKNRSVSLVKKKPKRDALSGVNKKIPEPQQSLGDKSNEMDTFIRGLRIKEAQLLRYLNASIEQKNQSATKEVDAIISSTRINIANLEAEKVKINQQLSSGITPEEVFVPYSSDEESESPKTPTSQTFEEPKKIQPTISKSTNQSIRNGNIKVKDLLKKYENLG